MSSWGTKGTRILNVAVWVCSDQNCELQNVYNHCYLQRRVQIFGFYYIYTLKSINYKQHQTC